MTFPIVSLMRRINSAEQLTELRKFASDKSFQAKWAAVKRQKKAKLADLIKKVHGEEVNLDALFDIQVGGGSGEVPDPAELWLLAG